MVLFPATQPSDPTILERSPVWYSGRTLQRTGSKGTLRPSLPPSHPPPFPSPMSPRCLFRRGDVVAGGEGPGLTSSSDPRCLSHPETKNFSGPLLPCCFEKPPTGGYGSGREDKRVHGGIETTMGVKSLPLCRRLSYRTGRSVSSFPV